MATPAQARFEICNQTFDVVNVAIGFAREGSFGTEGWWTIGPNRCASVIEEPLRGSTVFVFAQDVFGNVVLEGSRPMCVEPDTFEVEGRQDCLGRGLIEARFLGVETGTAESWTLYLRAPAGEG